MNNRARKLLLLLLETAATVLSPLYMAASGVRNILYDKGLFKKAGLPLPVISVGNITFGGAGKTPLVVYLCRLLKFEGLRPAILARGYRSGVGDDPKIVPPRGGYREGRGDEPSMMAFLLRDVPVIISPDRLASGQLAHERYEIDLFILDDAFQHRRVERGLDILVIDSERPFGSIGPLPGFSLRECPTALKRAGMVVLTRCRENRENNRVEKIVRRFNKNVPIFHALSFGELFRSIRENIPLFGRDLKGKKVIALAGIANPRRFFSDLGSFQPDLCDEIVFGDHHPYTQEEIDRICALARRQGAEAVVTTHKDAIRLEGLDFHGIPFLYREMKLKIVEEDFFRETILGTLRSFESPEREGPRR